MSQTEKLFYIPYARVISEASGFKSLYSQDHAAFEAEDPAVFTPTYEADFGTLITTAASAGTDETYMDSVEAQTAIVEAKMEECRIYVQNTARYWIGKAFGKGSPRFKEFGYDDYNASRNSHDKMILLMQNFKTKLAEYNTELTAAGMSAPDITLGGTLADALLGLKGGQKSQIRGRGTETDDRIQKFNAVWEVMVQLNDAAQMVFTTDPARMALYNMPDSDDVHTYSGPVLASSTAEVFHRQLSGTETITLTNDGTADWAAELVKLQGDPATLVPVLAGASVTKLASELGDVTQNLFLNITNSSPGDGHYHIVIS